MFFLVVLGGALILGYSIRNKKAVVEVIREVNYTEKRGYPKEVLGVPVNVELIDIGKARPGVKRKIKYVVIHETDNYKQGVGAKNHAIFLKSNNTSTTSWHYTVDDKEIYQHVPDNEIAHHVGDKAGNYFGIGIELCVNRDGDFEKTYDNAAKLVAYLLKEYDLDITSIKMHHHFIDKDCPNKIMKSNRFLEFRKRVLGYITEV